MSFREEVLESHVVSSDCEGKFIVFYPGAGLEVEVATS